MLQLARRNGTALLVVADVDAKPGELVPVAVKPNSAHFDIADAARRPLAVRLADKIRSVLADPTDTPMEVSSASPSWSSAVVGTEPPPELESAVEEPQQALINTKREYCSNRFNV